MNSVKYADFMRVLDYLTFEGKYDRALNDRVRTDFQEPFGSEQGFPCLAVELPDTPHIQDLFLFTLQEVVLPAYATPLRKVCERADVGDVMFLYFPGWTLEGRS